MTKKERDDIIEILNTSKWDYKSRLTEYLENATVEEENAPESPTDARTPSQNRSIHLWFRQIADLCKDAGIDGKMVMAKTVSVEMNEHIIKGMWKALQQALFKKGSTTELKKTGEIDKLQDHFIRFFGENFNLELPPFPSDESLHKPKLTHVEHMKNVEDYPEYKEPTI